MDGISALISQRGCESKHSRPNWEIHQFTLKTHITLGILPTSTTNPGFYLAQLGLFFQYLYCQRLLLANSALIFTVWRNKPPRPPELNKEKGRPDIEIQQSRLEGLPPHSRAGLSPGAVGKKAGSALKRFGFKFHLIY